MSNQNLAPAPAALISETTEDLLPIPGVPVMPVMPVIKDVLNHVHDGRFQRSLALVAGASGILSGIEVSLEHYRGSFGQRVMYSPVVLSGALAATGVATSFRPRLARVALPIASWALILDGVIGFGFHIRGIARKPGGWRPRYLLFNLVMGPPIFAPLLLGMGGGLGLVASRLRPEEETAPIPYAERVRLRQLLAGATAASAFLNGFEALYSHYKSRFSSRSQWIPIVLTPPLIAAGIGAIYRPKVAKTALPVLSVVAMAAGGIGAYHHMRATMKRPGGLKKRPLYNLTYGPPPLAPLLFAATGLLGLLASRIEPSE